MSERVAPRQPGEWVSRDSYLMYLRHLAAYEFVRPKAAGRRVLDLGSGTGYGSTFLAAGAHGVVALDVALDALLTTKLRATNVMSVAGDGAWLPLRDKSFDLVVSFQVIEHMQNETRYLDEVRRVLTPDGLFVVSTPNKALRLLPLQPPFNPYHVREYDYRAFKELLTRWFADVTILGMSATPEIMAIERERLKQNPVRVYLELVAQKTLPAAALQGFLSLLGTLRRRRSSGKREAANNATPSLSEEAYSFNDLWIDAHGVEKSLDLIGICRKC